MEVKTFLGLVEVLVHGCVHVHVCALSVLQADVWFVTPAGYIAPWSGRFYSLWDTG